MKATKDNPYPKDFEEFMDWFATEQGCHEYLDEYAFRFNRRTSTHRGKLFHRLVQQAATTRPKNIKDFYNHKEAK